MNQDYCSYELSKALKACGFDEPCHYGYSVKMRLEPEVSFGEPKMVHSKDPKNYNDNRKGIEKGLSFYSVPTLAHAQKWLREKKGIDALVYNCACGYTWEVSKAKNGTGIILFDDNGDDKDSGCWTSYEAALSAGIASALELIKKGE